MAARRPTLRERVAAAILEAAAGVLAERGERASMSDPRLARVRATLRRNGSVLESSLPSYSYGELELDFSARRVRVAGRDISLTPKQYDVLAYLARNAGKVLTHRQILQVVWGGQYADEVDYVWTYVRRIRRRIEIDPATPKFLLTEPGIGYRMPTQET